MAVGLLCLLAPAWLGAQALPVDPNDASASIGERPDRPATPRTVAPVTSGLPLNNTQIDHRTDWDVALGVISGSDRNSTPTLRGTFKLQADLQERQDGNLFVREQQGWYGQAITFNRIRDVTLTRTTPVDLIGFHLQLSITGTCLLPGTPQEAYCTYTPGVSVDATSLDPDFLVPTRFLTESNFGAQVDDATLEAIRQPGWRRSVPGGQQIGLDMDFPNSGYLPSEERRGQGGVTRREEVEIGQVLALARVGQELLSNHEGATLARTIRGLALPTFHDWSNRAVGWQLLAWILPALEPKPPDTSKEPYLRINNNLFLAANNARLPRDSLTLYHSGIARVTHATRPVRRLADVPYASFSGIWLGLSPIIDRIQTRSLRLQTVGPRETVNSSFTQGGDLSGISGVTRIAFIDGVLDELDLGLLEDPFMQLGLRFTEQAAFLTSSSQLVETTRYVPSFSLTGTLTGAEHVLRYYAGAMEGEDPDAFTLNAYLGADWTYNAAKGLRLNVAAIGYSKPNYDYFSEMNASIGKIFQLPKETKLTLRTTAAYSFDRPGDFEDFVLDYDGSRLDVSGLIERGKLNLSVTQGIAEVLPDSRAPFTTLGIGYRVTPRLELSARYTPYSEQTSYLSAQAGLTWRISDHSSNPSLRLQWSRIQYDYGQDSFGDPLGATEDVLMLLFQMRFNEGS